MKIRRIIKSAFDWDNFDESVENVVDSIPGAYNLQFWDNGDFEFDCDCNLADVQKTFKDAGFDYWWKFEPNYNGGYRFNHENGSPNPDTLEGEY